MKTTIMIALLCKKIKGVMGVSERKAHVLSGLTYAEALQRLEIEYTAANGGGWPDCLKGVSKEVRLNTVKALGYRPTRWFEVDVSALNEPPQIAQWAVLSGGISVCLTDGFVCLRGGGVSG